MSKLLQIFGLFFLTLALTNSKVFNGYEIWDLDSTNAYFPTQAASWTITNRITSDNATQCATNWILGGYQIIGMHGSFSKTYNNLPAHTAIQFAMSFWIIDCQEQSDLFQIYFDSQMVGQWDSDAYGASSNQYPNICAGSYQDFPNLPVKGNVPHSNTSLTFEVLSMYSSSSSTFSFGFRDIHLLFTNSTVSTTTTCQFRLVSSSNTQPSCLCQQQNQYNTAGSSSCSSCNSACQTCIGPQASDCTSCKTGYSFISGSCRQCNSACAECSDTTESGCVRCSSSSAFLYYNGTCQTSCSSPLVSESIANVSRCVSPCSANEYLYQNGSCSTTCDAPFVQVLQANTKFCNTPCATSQYLYWNSSCLSSCPTPFQGTNNTVAICNFYCSQDKYTYWNNTCSTSCSSPLLRSTNNYSYQFCKKPCPDGDYLLQNGSCIDYCNYANYTTSDGVLMCSAACRSNEYLYWNGSCISSCSNPLKNSSANGYNNTCSKPCSDNSYLLPNGSCSNSCNYANQTTSDGVLLCSGSCQNNEYLYWNGSCLSTCNSPLQPRVDNNSASYCSKPCPADNYLLPNGSCIAYCDYVNQTTSDGVLTCSDPCSQSEFLYSNKTCISSCNSPYQITSPIQNYALCSPPCSTGQYYNADDGSCLSQCDPPLVVQQNGDYQTCKNGIIITNKTVTSSGGSNQTQPSSTSESDSEDPFANYHPATRVVGEATVRLSAVSGFLRSNDTDSAFMVALAKLVKYVKYINLKLPDDVERAFQSQKAISFSIPTSFTIKMPAFLISGLENRPLPEVFQNQGVYSSYLMNQWDNITIFFVFFMAGAFFGILEATIQRFGKVKIVLTIVSKFRMIFKWNMLSFLFFNSYDDIIFYTIIEFKTLHLTNFWSYLSFFTCIVTALAAIYLLVNVFLVSRARIRKLREIQGRNLEEHEDLKFYKKWENHQVLYSGFQEESLLKLLCLLIITLQPIAFYLVVGLLYEHPLVQTALLTVITVLILAYLLILQPMKDRFNLFVAVIFEALCLVVNICLMIVAIMEHRNVVSESTLSGVCEAIIVSNMLVSLFSNIFMWAFILIGIKTAYKSSVGKDFKQKTVWLGLLVVPYQNPGMDFDDKSNEAFGVPVTPEDEKDLHVKKVQTDDEVGKVRKIHPFIVKTLLPTSPTASNKDSVDKRSSALETEKSLIANSVTNASTLVTQLNLDEEQHSNQPRRSKFLYQGRMSSANTYASRIPELTIAEEMSSPKTSDSMHADPMNKDANAFNSSASKVPRDSLAAIFQRPMGHSVSQKAFTADLYRKNMSTSILPGNLSRNFKNPSSFYIHHNDEENSHSSSDNADKNSDNFGLSLNETESPSAKAEMSPKNAVRKYVPAQSSKQRFTGSTIFGPGINVSENTENSMDADFLNVVKSPHIISDEETIHNEQPIYLLDSPQNEKVKRRNTRLNLKANVPRGSLMMNFFGS